MQSALHIAGSGFQRLGLAVVAIAVTVLLGYSLLVMVVVGVQAFGAFGQ